MLELNIALFLFIVASRVPEGARRIIVVAPQVQRIFVKLIKVNSFKVFYKLFANVCSTA